MIRWARTTVLPATGRYSTDYNGITQASKKALEIVGIALSCGRGGDSAPMFLLPGSRRRFMPNSRRKVKNARACASAPTASRCCRRRRCRYRGPSLDISGGCRRLALTRPTRHRVRQFTIGTDGQATSSQLKRIAPDQQSEALAVTASSRNAAEVMVASSSAENTHEASARRGLLSVPAPLTDFFAGTII